VNAFLIILSLTEGPNYSHTFILLLLLFYIQISSFSILSVYGSSYIERLCASITS
jgi:hypothetical protein